MNMSRCIPNCILFGCGLATLGITVAIIITCVVESLPSSDFKWRNHCIHERCYYTNEVGKTSYSPCSCYYEADNGVEQKTCDDVVTVTPLTIAVRYLVGVCIFIIVFNVLCLSKHKREQEEQEQNEKEDYLPEDVSPAEISVVLHHDKEESPHATDAFGFTEAGTCTISILHTTVETQDKAVAKKGILKNSTVATATAPSAAAVAVPTTSAGNATSTTATTTAVAEVKGKKQNQKYVPLATFFMEYADCV